MTRPRCRACRHPLTATLTAELLAGMPMRKLAATYGLSAAALCRHQGHVKRGGSAGLASVPLRLDVSQAPPTTSDGHSTQPVEPGDGTSVDHADNPRLPRFVRKMMSRTANVRSAGLAREVGDIAKLETWLADLAAPLKDIVPPGVAVHVGNVGAYTEHYAVPLDERGNDENDRWG